MAENKGQTRGIRISDRLLIVLAVLIGITLLAAVFVVPKYGKVFSQYRALRSEYKAAGAALETAQEKNTELTAKLDEMKTMKKESDDLSAEVFTMAAKLEKDINDGMSNKRICYITLDDGPYNRGKKFLELFAKYDVKATFFLTTANGNKLPDQADLTATSMYPEYLKYGHTIGNHTYSHNYNEGGIYSSKNAFMKSVEKQQKFTQDATGGYTPQIVRFPGGSATAGSKYDAIAEALRKEGLVWIDWTVDSGDSWGGDKVTPELIVKNIKEAAKKQKIMVILCHEWSQNSLEAMPEVIEYLDEQGYIFLPLFPESITVKR
jgi:peptidoglycan/xylan/chitin deacetylase (PgdA/CDA1 family)